MSEEMSGRNPDGTFAEGNTFSDGRNKYARQQELRAMFTAAVTDSEIQRLANKLMGLALGGDLTAAKILTGILFREQPGPQVALQINNQATANESDRKAKTAALINRMQQANRLRAAGVHDHRPADQVIEVQAKRGTGDLS